METDVNSFIPTSNNNDYKFTSCPNVLPRVAEKLSPILLPSMFIDKEVRPVNAEIPYKINSKFVAEIKLLSNVKERVLRFVREESYEPI